MFCGRAAVWSFLLAFAPLMAAAGEVPAEAKRLQGTWKLVRLERGGQPVADAFRDSARVVIEGETLAFHVGGETLYKLRFTLVPIQSPRHIDLTSLDEPGRGRSLRGIYTLAGNRLTLCWPLDADAARPADFRGNGQRDVTTLVLERE
jgi:uncharacterized protein (TIGR03067 family)